MTYFLTNAAGLSVVALLLLGIRNRSAGRFSYAYVFSAAWAIFLVGSQLALGGRIRPAEGTVVTLYAAWAIFLAVQLFASSLLPVRPSPEVPRIRRVPGLIVLSLLVVGNVAVTYLQVRSYGLWSSGSNLRQLVATLPDARIAGLTREFDPPWYSQVFLGAYIYYLPLAVTLLRQRLIRRRTVVALSALAVVLGLSQYTRAPLIQIGMSLLVASLIVFRIRARSAALLGMAAAALLLVFAIGMQTVLQDRAQRGDTSESVQIYAFGSAKAYETILSGRYDARQDTYYSFEAPGYVLWKFGLVSSYPEPIRRYTFIGPYATNTYTFLDAYTLDFGVAGMLLGVGLLGLMCALVEYWVFSRPSFPAIVAYSYVITAMVMSVWNHELGRIGFPLAVGIAFAISGLVRDRGASPVPPRDRRLPVSGMPQQGAYEDRLGV